jgi:PPOX class probable F420-dependent enzyme
VTERLSAEQEALFRAPVHAVLTTINPDGQPQSSVVWTKVDDGQVVFSTIRGRRKTRNMERDPRVSLLAYDPADPGSYLEVRGTVTLDEAGGPELIDELSRAYDHEPWDPDGDGTRVVARIGAERIVVR